MSYEAQIAQLARVAMGHHGQLKEVILLSPNKDFLLVFSDGTVLRPDSDADLTREYRTYAGYGEVAAQLGGTHPYSLLAFGYQGTGPTCFSRFLQVAGFKSTDVVNITTPVRLRRDGTQVRGTSQGGQYQWEDGSPMPGTGSTPEGRSTAKWWQFWK